MECLAWSISRGLINTLAVKNKPPTDPYYFQNAVLCNFNSNKHNFKSVRTIFNHNKAFILTAKVLTWPKDFHQDRSSG